ncbi:DNA mismatch repair protein MLH3-like [Solanum dulcamara]|uniref:DNA mismatch repair protein MLH3-like n=1 Tax=Solanum dulcamara TaxID=45834 RepID=UPI00248646FC|nr:DNA mismatch repair protein MLH3-like [Solanum dulcamara]
MLSLFIYLLEMVTKTHWRPNEYRKVLKDDKCLYLGLMIVDKSPKRVSHSLKEPLLRIALVHLSVSFKIVDIESEYDLLFTRASPSPLPLFSSGFGIHLSFLNNLNAIDGSFKLSRYILGCDAYTVKVLQ